ncbi:unnamed protein product [Clonostachys rosea]|uniref:Uncharacterized protein n=1 Tax=Bionectria ochroleuca TaxID=29856 RepID=A0ABY6UAQ0_BIOOC|nr:unnamed protein product [Clonostachys rosea]
MEDNEWMDEPMSDNECMDGCAMTGENAVEGSHPDDLQGTGTGDGFKIKGIHGMLVFVIYLIGL